MSIAAEPTSRSLGGRARLLSGKLGHRLASDLRSRFTRYVVGTILLWWCLNAVFMVRDHTAPSWDQSYYLGNAWTMFIAHRQSLGEVFRTIMNTDPTHGPLYELSVAFFMGIVGPFQNSALLVNLVALILLCWSIAYLSRRVAGPRAVPWALALTLTMPLMVGLSRAILADFLLIALTTFALMAAVRCRRFGSLRWSCVLGVAFAAAVLAKVTAPVEVGLALVAALVLGEDSITFKRPSQEQLRNFAVAVAVSLILTLWWYIPHYSDTVAYIKSTTTGPLSLGEGPNDPLAWAALKSYGTAIINQHTGWGVIVVGLIGLAFAGTGVWRSFLHARGAASGAARVDRAALLLFPVLWVVPSVAIQAASKAQDQRLIGPALIGTCLIAAALISRVRFLVPRVAAAGAIALFVGWPLAMHTFGPDSNHVDSSMLVVASPVGDLFSVLGNSPVGYETAPEPTDHAQPVVSWLLRQRARSGIAGPATVGVLDTNAELNGNTFRWLDLRTSGGVTRIVTLEPSTVGESSAQIRSEFNSYDAVITFSNSATPTTGRGGDLNAQIVTTGAAAKYLAAFNGPHAVFPLETGEAEVRWRSRGKLPGAP